MEKTSSWLQGMSSEDDSHSKYHNSWAQDRETTTRGARANPSRSPRKVNSNSGSAQGSLSYGMSSKNSQVHNSWAQTMILDKGKKFAEHVEHENDWSNELAKHELLTNCKPVIATNREKYEAEETSAMAMVVPKMRDILEPARSRASRRVRAATEPAHLQSTSLSRNMSVKGLVDVFDNDQIAKTVNNKDATQKPDVLVFETGMSPTKTGSYGIVGQAEIRETHGFARVVSHRAVLESTGSPHQDNAEYSPSVYGGVWENDPKVGLTLPPFSPEMKTSMSFGPDNIESKQGVNEPSHESTAPVMARFVQRLAAPSMDSMASSGQTDKEPFHPSAEVLPLFGWDRKVKSAPAPPKTFSGSEPTKAFDVARLEQSLHHHIDVRFERLSRLVVERSDKVIDEMSKMMETWEEELRKGLRRSIKQDLVALKTEFENLGHDLHGISANSLESKRALRTINSKMAHLEASIHETVCQCGDPRFRQNPYVMSVTVPGIALSHQHFQGWKKVDFNGVAGGLHALDGPKTKTAEEGITKDMEIDDPVVTTEPDVCDSGNEEPSVPLGIRGPNGVLYELPSFMKIDENGEAVVNLPLVEGSMPALGIRGPNGVLYELPSFMTMDENGEALVNLPPVEGPMPAPGIRGPNGVLYELPSFMTIGEDGQPEIIPEQDDSLEATEATEAASALGWVEGPDGETEIETSITSMLSCILPSLHQE